MVPFSIIENFMLLPTQLDMLLDMIFSNKIILKISLTTFSLHLNTAYFAEN